MQSLIDNMFGQFVQAVSEGRGMKFEDVKSIANGKVWTGEQAMSMKLIDGVGDFETAVADTAKSVGIKGEPTLVRPDRDRKTRRAACVGVSALGPGSRRCWSSKRGSTICGSTRPADARPFCSFPKPGPFRRQVLEHRSVP
jgi:ClpP class serine protease